MISFTVRWSNSRNLFVLDVLVNDQVLQSGLQVDAELLRRDCDLAFTNKQDDQSLGVKRKGIPTLLTILTKCS